MTSDEARDILRILGWSQGDLAAYANRNNDFIRQQLRGRKPIDEPLAIWLRELRFRREHPEVQRYLSMLEAPPPRPGDSANAAPDVEIDLL